MLTTQHIRVLCGNQQGPATVVSALYVSSSPRGFSTRRVGKKVAGGRSVAETTGSQVDNRSHPGGVPEFLQAFSVHHSLR